MGLTLGHVFKRTAEIVRANFGLLAIATGLLLLPSSVSNGVISRLNNPQTLADGDATTIFGYAGLGLLNWFVSIALFGLSQAVVMTISVDSMSGVQPTFGAAFRRAFARFWPLVLAIILTTIVLMGGFLLCIIPGLILVAGLALTIPVVVTEDVSAVESLRRSWKLTRGHRTVIFGAFLAVGIFVSAIQIGLHLGLLGNPLQSPEAMFKVPLGVWVAHQSLSYVVAVFFVAIASVLSAVLYIEIKGTKEGVDVESLAAVFT